MMRFANIDSFGVDELLLDEGNYRFRKAPDQQACIEKIYRSNPAYFSNLMTSIAEDDLGELLLVWMDDGEAIVLDGNRRSAVIKVLWNPDLAPTASLKKKAELLAAKTQFDFDNIQAQVSESKEKIYKTVYERHASSNGSRRISWSAIAAARFRYDWKIADNNQYWHATALIFELESNSPEISEFIDSKDYSHEVFTRVVRAALSRGIISKNIFSEKDMRIKKRPKKLIDDAIDKAQILLTSIKNKELSLSRKGSTYADADKIEEYLSQFNVVEEKDAKKEGASSEQSNTQNTQEDSKNNNNTDNSESGSNQNGNTNDEQSSNGNPPPKIPMSVNITSAVNLLGSDKLDQLYSSLCTISLRKHATLMMVGAWTFLEALATLAGKGANTGLESFYNTKINEWYKDKGEKAEFKSSVKYIVDEGNVIKHGQIAHSFDARHLAVHFQIIEPLLLKTIKFAANKS
ncbi:hypothetical protein [Kangiella sp.]|uniref:hypothetical protein n=1 Tax=Kangiella sp. TaxID=1920245 RepID=UPI0019C323CF|nr:hypothetical protein [Kangiella sp.]MBD3654299.1 hypothetical protein [Kangiella sp.]